MAPNFGIISPLAEVVDRRGANFAAGLGDASISEELSYAKGLQSGMATGASFESITSETRRLNDPERLAQEALNRQLANIQLEKQIETITINNDTLDEQNRATIANTRAGTGLTVAQTEGVVVTTDINKRFGAAKAQADIAQSRAAAASSYASANKASQEAAILRETGLEKAQADIFKTRSEGYEKLAGKEAEAAAPIPGMPSGQDFPEEGAPAVPGYKPGSGVVPSGNPAAAPAAETPVQRLQRLTADRESALILNKNIQDQLQQKNSFAMGIDATELAIRKSQENYNQAIAAKRNFNDLVTAGEKDRDFEGTPNFAVGIPTLLRLGEQVKRVKDVPELQAVVSNYITEGLKPYGGAEGFTEYVDNQVAAQEMSPDQGRALKSSIFGSVARSVSPEDLPGEQKNIRTAGFGIKHMEDPEKTYDKVIQVLQGDTAGINDPEFNKLARTNDYFNAAREASKWGKQPFKMVSGDGPTNPNPTDVAGKGGTPKVMKFIGADGTTAYGPDPQTDAQFAMLDILEKSQTRLATISGTKAANTQLQQGIEVAQSDVQQATQPAKPAGQPASRTQQAVADNTYIDVLPEGASPTLGDVATPTPTPEGQLLGQIRQGQQASGGLMNQEQQLLAGGGPGSAAGAFAGQAVNGQAGPVTTAQQVPPGAPVVAPDSAPKYTPVEAIPAGGQAEIAPGVTAAKSLTGENVRVTTTNAIPGEKLTTDRNPPNQPTQREVLMTEGTRRGMNDPQKYANDTIESHEKAITPLREQADTARALVTSSLKRTQAIDTLLKDLKDSGNEDLLSLLGEEKATFEKWASAAVGNPVRTTHISRIRQLTAASTLDLVRSKAAGTGMLNTGKEAEFWTQALFAPGQTYEAVQQINEDTKLAMSKEKETVDLMTFLTSQGPKVGADTIRRAVLEYGVSPKSDPTSKERQTHKQFLGHDIETPTLTGGSSTPASPLDKTVPVIGTTGGSSTTSSSSSASSSSSSSSSGAAALPPSTPPEVKQAVEAHNETVATKGGSFLDNVVNGLGAAAQTLTGIPVNYLRENQTGIGKAIGEYAPDTKILEKRMQDPEFAQAVKESREVLENIRNPENTLGEPTAGNLVFGAKVLNSITPDFIMNGVEKMNGALTNLVSSAVGAVDEEAGKALKDDIEAYRVAYNDMFEDDKVSKPGQQLAAQAAGMLIAFNGFKKAGVVGLEKLAKEIPPFQKVVKFLDADTKLAGTARALLTVGGDVAANRVVTDSPSKEQDTFVGGMSLLFSGAAKGASMLAQSRFGQMVKSRFSAPDPYAAMADLLVEQGLTPGPILESIKQARAEGLSPLARLDPGTREVMEKLFSTKGGQTALRESGKAVSEQSQKVAAVAEAKTGLGTAKSTPEIAKQFETDVNASITKATEAHLAAGEAAGQAVKTAEEGTRQATMTVERLNKDNQLTGMIKTVFSGGVDDAQKAINATNEILGNVQATIKTQLKAGGAPGDMLEQSIKDVDVVKQVVVDHQSPLFKELEAQYKNLPPEFVGKTITQLGDQFGTVGKRAIDMADEGLLGIETAGEHSLKRLAEIRNVVAHKNFSDTVNLEQRTLMLSFLDNSIDKAIVESGGNPATFTSFLKQYGKSSEVVKHLEKRKEVLETMFNETQSIQLTGSRSNLYGKFFGGSGVPRKAMNEALGEETAREFSKSAAAFDKSINTVLDLTEESAKAAGKPIENLNSKAALELNENLAAAKDLLGKNTILGENLVKGRPDTIDKVFAALSDDNKELVSQSALRYFRDQMDNLAIGNKAKAISTADDTVGTLLGINQTQYKNLKAMLATTPNGANQAKLLDIFLDTKVGVGNIESLLATTSGGGSGSAITTLMEKIGWRRALETRGKIGMDIAATSMFNSLKKAEQEGIMKFALDPDPAKVADSFEQVANMMAVEPTRSGVAAVVRRNIIESSPLSRDAIRAAFIQMWLGQANQYKARREVAGRNARRLESAKKLAELP